MGVVAASAPVAERSVKLKGLSDSQVPQGSGLLCQLLQRSCMVGRVGANALVGSELSSNNWWFPSNFCEPYGVFTCVSRDLSQGHVVASGKSL